MLRAMLTRSGGDADPWNLAGNVAELEATHRANHPAPMLPLLRKAYRIAEQMHRGQNRRSGEPYITHPIEVAKILAGLGLDTTTLAAALLHDTVEDTSYTLERLRGDFGDEVAVLVDGVTKLDKVYFGDAAEAETFRKLIVTGGRDIRVMVIKLADRLHNMRTLRFKSRSGQIRIAEATRDVLIPLADRLGLYVIKRELEDLVLSTLDPDTHAEIDHFLQTNAERAACIAEALPQLRTALRQSKVTAKILDRPRHHYSVYRELAVNPRSGPTDPPRVVIVVNGPETECYAALGAVHGRWRPVLGRFKDFIASAKFNLYQSLHTTVVGPHDEPMDVLIRTAEMHQVAELGIVAQLNVEKTHTGRSTRQLPWLRRLLEWQGDAVDSAKFLDSLRCDLADEQILVFSTDGVQHMLPIAATPVDLAYACDTTMGDRLIGAYVNGTLAPLSHPLSDGDLVELINAASDGDYPGPAEEWLLTAKTPRAQMQIAEWFAGRRGQPSGTDGASPGQRTEDDPRTLADQMSAGRSAIHAALRQRGRGLVVDQPLLSLASTLGYPDLDALYLSVHQEKLDAGELADQLIASVDRRPEPAPWPERT